MPRLSKAARSMGNSQTSISAFRQAMEDHSPPDASARKLYGTIITAIEAARSRYMAQDAPPQSRSPPPLAPMPPCAAIRTNLRSLCLGGGGRGVPRTSVAASAYSPYFTQAAFSVCSTSALLRAVVVRPRPQLNDAKKTYLEIARDGLAASTHRDCPICIKILWSNDVTPLDMAMWNDHFPSLASPFDLYD